MNYNLTWFYEKMRDWYNSERLDPVKREYKSTSNVYVMKELLNDLSTLDGIMVTLGGGNFDFANVELKAGWLELYCLVGNKAEDYIKLEIKPSKALLRYSPFPEKTFFAIKSDLKLEDDVIFEEERKVITGSPIIVYYRNRWLEKRTQRLLKQFEKW